MREIDHEPSVVQPHTSKVRVVAATARDSLIMTELPVRMGAAIAQWIEPVEMNCRSAKSATSDTLQVVAGKVSRFSA